MSKILTGNVTSNKGDKTIVVTVQTHKMHPLYRKKYLSSKKFLAHDEKNEAKVGDRVTITETRPISRLKHHKLETIIERPVLKDEDIKAASNEETA